MAQRLAKGRAFIQKMAIIASLGLGVGREGGEVETSNGGKVGLDKYLEFSKGRIMTACRNL